MTKHLSQNLIIFSISILCTQSSYAMGGNAPTPSAQQIRGLDFGAKVGGSPTTTIDPSDDSSGLIRLSGRANETYTVYAKHNSVTLESDGSPSTPKLVVSSFNFPQELQLSPQGTAELHFGATMGSVPYSVSEGIHYAYVEVCFKKTNSTQEICTDLSINATVIASLAVTNNQSLSFGIVKQGQEATTVSPDSNSGSVFAISGSPSLSIFYVLPADGIVQLIHPEEGLLEVNAFTASPPQAELSPTGYLQVGVGATLQSIPSDQPKGCYSGTFSFFTAYDFLANFHLNAPMMATANSTVTVCVE